MTVTHSGCRFADRALRELSPVFDEMYAAGGRPSIPPERLLKASLADLSVANPKSAHRQIR